MDKNEIQSLKKALDDVSGQIKQHAELAAKNNGISESVKADVDRLLSIQASVNSRIHELELISAKHEVEGRGTLPKPNSLGQIVVESDEFKSFRGNGRFTVSTPSAAITSGSSSAGATIEPMRVAGIVAPGQQRLTIRDLLNWGRTASNSVEYVRETGFTNSAAPVAEAALNQNQISHLPSRLRLLQRLRTLSGRRGRYCLMRRCYPVISMAGCVMVLG